MKKGLMTCVSVIVLGLLVSGCCTIIHSATQDVGVSSNPTGAKVSVNGREMGPTPITLALRRKESNTITIEMEGYQPYQIPITKSMSGWVWGNIFFGGVIGLVVDGMTGAIYSMTPENITANLLKSEDTLNVQTMKDVPKGGEKIGQMEKTPAEQLKELKELKDKGILTDEEYEAKRKRLVDKL